MAVCSGRAWSSSDADAAVYVSQGVKENKKLQTCATKSSSSGDGRMIPVNLKSSTAFGALARSLPPIIWSLNGEWIFIYLILIFHT